MPYCRQDGRIAICWWKCALYRKHPLEDLCPISIEQDAIVDFKNKVVHFQVFYFSIFLTQTLYQFFGRKSLNEKRHFLAVSSFQLAVRKNNLKENQYLHLEKKHQRRPKFVKVWGGWKKSSNLMNTSGIATIVIPKCWVYIQKIITLLISTLILVIKYCIYLPQPCVQTA